MTNKTYTDPPQIPLPQELEALPRLGRPPILMARPGNVYPLSLRSSEERTRTATTEGGSATIEEHKK